MQRGSLPLALGDRETCHSWPDQASSAYSEFTVHRERVNATFCSVIALLGLVAAGEVRTAEYSVDDALCAWEINVASHLVPAADAAAFKDKLVQELSPRLDDGPPTEFEVSKPLDADYWREKTYYPTTKALDIAVGLSTVKECSVSPVFVDDLGSSTVALACSPLGSSAGLMQTFEAVAESGVAAATYELTLVDGPFHGEWPKTIDGEISMNIDSGSLVRLSISCDDSRATRRRARDAAAHAKAGAEDR